MIIRFLLPTVIADDVGVAIFFRKLVVLVENSPGRRAAAHVENPRQTVDVVRRIGADFLPTLVAAEKWNGVLPTTMLPGNSVPFVNVTK